MPGLMLAEMTISQDWFFNIKENFITNHHCVRCITRTQLPFFLFLKGEESSSLFAAFLYLMNSKYKKGKE